MPVHRSTTISLLLAAATSTACVGEIDGSDQTDGNETETTPVFRAERLVLYTDHEGTTLVEVPKGKDYFAVLTDEDGNVYTSGRCVAEVFTYEPSTDETVAYFDCDLPKLGPDSNSFLLDHNPNSEEAGLISRVTWIVNHTPAWPPSTYWSSYLNFSNYYSFENGFSPGVTIKIFEGGGELELPPERGDSE